MEPRCCIHPSPPVFPPSSSFAAVFSLLSFITCRRGRPELQATPTSHIHVPNVRTRSRMTRVPVSWKHEKSSVSPHIANQLKDIRTGPDCTEWAGPVWRSRSRFLVMLWGFFSTSSFLFQYIMLVGFRYPGFRDSSVCIYWFPYFLVTVWGFSGFSILCFIVSRLLLLF